VLALTGTIASSMRIYAAIPHDQHRRRVEVPSGFTHFPGDTLHPRPRTLWPQGSTVIVQSCFRRVIG
jgi:hypothetical protein